MEFTPVKSNLLVVMMRWGSSDEQNVLSFFRVGSCIAASGTISRKKISYTTIPKQHATMAQTNLCRKSPKKFISRRYIADHIRNCVECHRYEPDNWTSSNSTCIQTFQDDCCRSNLGQRWMFIVENVTLK